MLVTLVAHATIQFSALDPTPIITTLSLTSHAFKFYCLIPNLELLQFFVTWIFEILSIDNLYLSAVVSVQDASSPSFAVTSPLIVRKNPLYSI